MPRRSRSWSPAELHIIELIRSYCPIYRSVGRNQKMALDAGIWVDISAETGIPAEELKNKWRTWRSWYIRQKKMEMRCQVVHSKMLHGTLSFIDDEIDFPASVPAKNRDETSTDCEFILPDASINSQSVLSGKSSEDSVILIPSVTLSIEDIDVLLTKRKDNPNIDPATVEYLVNMVTKRLSETLKISTDCQSITVPALSPVGISTTETVSASKKSLNMPMHIDVEELVTPHMCGLPKEIFVNENMAVANKNMGVPQIVSTQSLPEPLEVDDSFETVFELHSTRSEMDAFFDDLGDYVMDKFTYDKQIELRLKICAVITQAELEEIEKAENKKKSNFTIL